ncbi:hypothetical protein ABIC83_002609 [Roseateles asaccharophilus]|uniref:hypothetical protein n=1 Tax=Roseateles asaccharophilus TaxID=582607 RepID=UPI003837DD63
MSTTATDQALSSADSDNATAQSPYVNWTSDEARQHLLFDIARTFKGIDPIVDAKIDANAGIISGKPEVKRIPGRIPGEPRVPFYMEGEPGVGKTTLIRSAIIEFCRITGLNFIENPPDDYDFTPNDFYYATVNLSGKTNTMDIGGLPSKGELRPSADNSEARRRAADTGEWLMAEVISRATMGAGMLKLSVNEKEEYANGNLRARDILIKGEAANVDLVVNNLIRQLSEASKDKGNALNLLQKDEKPEDGRMYIQVGKGAAGSRVTVMVPRAPANDGNVEYVAEMLPNRRFAMANKARFSLFNFDDVANASEAVRNVLLEVAQSNRYSGVMDIGNALVTFTGNMGAEDGTNTQSEQSDAEVTRLFKVRIRDTPEDWAARTAAKYAKTGDCMFSAFIHRFGNQAGVFRDAIGDARTERGIPKPNSRSLENALAKVLPYFIMARESNCSPTVFMDEIKIMVKGTAGPLVATRYEGFVKGMLTEAIPLADQLMKEGALDRAKFDQYVGSGARSSQQDFTFRFGTALADSMVERISFSDAAKSAGKDKEKVSELIADSSYRMCIGLASLEPGQQTYTLSRMMARLGGIGEHGKSDGASIKLTQSTFDALAEGFARSVKAGLWTDWEKAQKDFVGAIAGSNTGDNKKKAARRP